MLTELERRADIEAENSRMKLIRQAMTSRIENGISLRDWFAGQALIGLIANPSNSGSAESAAKISYGIADAMLAARRDKQ